MEEEPRWGRGLSRKWEEPNPEAEWGRSQSQKKKKKEKNSEISRIWGEKLRNFGQNLKEKKTPENKMATASGRGLKGSGWSLNREWVALNQSGRGLNREWAGLKQGVSGAQTGSGWCLNGVGGA